MIVFDLTDKESFNNIDSWLQEVQKHCGNEVNILIIANKADVGTKNLNAGVDGALGGSNPVGNSYGDEEEDQEREIEVTDEDIKNFEEKHKIKILKTSAKTGNGVDSAFLEMTKGLIKKQNSMTAEEKEKLQEQGKLGGQAKGLKAAKPNSPQKNSSCC